jgi:hypothetical protein
MLAAAMEVRLVCLPVVGHISLAGSILSRAGIMLDPLLLGRARREARIDQRGEQGRFRGNEPGDRAASVRARYRLFGRVSEQ